MQLSVFAKISTARGVGVCMKKIQRRTSWDAKLGRMTVAVCAIVFGAVMLWAGFHQAPDGGPDLKSPIFAPADQTPVGPTTLPNTTLGAQQKFVARNDSLVIPVLDVYVPIDTSNHYGTLSSDGFVIPDASKVTLLQESQANSHRKVDHSSRGFVIAGHITGQLKNLATLKAGNVAYYTNEKGVMREYELMSLQQYYKNNIPDNQLNPPANELVVITCGDLRYNNDGSWHYYKNTVAVMKQIA